LLAINNRQENDVAYTQNDLIALQNQKKRLIQQYTSTTSRIDALNATIQQQGFNTFQQFAESERLERSLEATAASMIEVDGEIFEAQLELDQYVPAGAATQAPPTVSPAQSPVAEQAEAPTRRNNRQRAQAQRSPAQDPEVQQQAEESFDEFSDIQRDISVEPEVPTQDEPVNTQENNRARAQAQRVQNASAEGVSLTSPAAEQVESNRQRAQEQRSNLNSTDTEDTDDTGYPGEDPFQELEFGANLKRAPADGVDPYGQDDEDEEDFPVTPPDPVPQVNSAALERLKSQAAIRATREPSIGKGDWRVRLQLAPNAPYFYNDPANRLLAPLRVTDGIIFPYTPRVNLNYRARYTPYEPTHSNYKHYWYQGSDVGEINMDATFTAQDTAEANYMLAVITFLKAASKMFYGQDADRGSPPPVLFLSGFGEYQFNQHPVVITQFNYNLPDDVNYIRANATQINGQAGTLQFRQNLNTNNSTLPSSRIRALINGLPTGADPNNTTPSGPNLGQNSPTYVPTKIELNVLLLPVQSRREVSQVFSLQKYANGDLLKRGFW